MDLGSIYSNVTCRSVAKNITQRMGETPMQSDVDDCLSAPGELADQDCNDCCDQFEYDKSQIIPETDSNCECLEQIPTNVEEEQRPAEIPAEIQVEILVEIPSNTPQQRLENLEKPEKPKDVCVFCSKKMPYSGFSLFLFKVSNANAKTITALLIDYLKSTVAPSIIDR